MQQICKAHMLISIGAIILPFNPASFLIIIMLNCTVMLRRIVMCQRRSEEIKNSGPIVRIAIKLTEFGMDVMTVVSVLSAAAVILFHNDIRSCSIFSQRKAHSWH